MIGTSTIGRRALIAAWLLLALLSVWPSLVARSQTTPAVVEILKNNSQH